MVNKTDGLGYDPFSNKQQHNFPQKEQIVSKEPPNQEKVFAQPKENPDENPELTFNFTIDEDSIKQLMRLGDFNYEEAKQVLEDREYYIRSAMRNGLTRKKAEKEVSPFF
jgi:hypothetical protein